MQDPVLVNGCDYDRPYILKYLAKHKGKDPKGKPVDLTKNFMQSSEKIRKMCGEGYQHMNFPWSTTNAKTGEITVHYRSENLKPL